MALLLSTFAIYFPDVSEMYQIILTAWMYLTPIIYPISIFPEEYKPLMRLNPMASLVDLFRIPIYDGRFLTWSEFWPAAAWSISILIFGWIFFSKKIDEFAYHV
jgi:ABC-2 type transport system permease protein